jgi:hypothetical protein
MIFLSNWIKFFLYALPIAKIVVFICLPHTELKVAEKIVKRGGLVI